MTDYLSESIKLQRIDFFIKLVAATDCDYRETQLAIQWVSELTHELVTNVRADEFNHSVDVSR